MKRHRALHPLSHDHHIGLVAARRLIKTGLGEFPVPETVEGFLEFWKESLEPHFKTEEAVFATIHPDLPLTRLQAEHEAMRTVVFLLRGRGEDRLRVLLGELGHALHDHIRFEEREFFPAVEKSLDEAALQKLGRALEEARPKTCLPPEQLKLLQEAMTPGSNSRKDK